MDAVRSSAPRAARAIAWLGGAAFVGSLACCAWFIAVALERPVAPLGAGATARAILVDLALFTLFATHHSAMARPGVKAWIHRHLGSGLERPLYVWTASLLLALTCLCWQGIPGGLYHVTGAAAWLARVVEAAGVAIIVAATRVIDPLELAGIRQLDRPRDPALLQIRGPYRRVRHPLYLGWMLLVFAAPALTLNRLLFAVLTSGYLLVAIPWEEASLTRTFGEAYAAYQRQVRWKVLPGVY